MNVCALVLCFSLAGMPRPAERWFAEDKLKHFFASFVVTTLAASGARAAGLDAQPSLVAGAAVGTAAGVWKEIRDARQPDGFASALDLVWDLAGVGAAVAVAAQARAGAAAAAAAK